MDSPSKPLGVRITPKCNIYTLGGVMSKKPEAFVYNAKLKRVVDGDTVDAYIDLGFDVWVTKRIRFHGVDTWECRTRNKEEKKLGLAAKAFTAEHLEKNEGKFLLKSHGVGKYGRVIGELFLHHESQSLNELLIQEGHAYVYEGGTKKVFKG